ncbi:peptide ABC transporter substrate-binding protein [Bifidobacterium sp. SMB2]|uniref:Peptide ABC transporter substrate-binding protein n=1 Tax=Bifidobacterium saimiriisciurei TaxID=2661627 RepID=A0ABX0CBF1_9BIFI|nr:MULTISPECIES: ABC transporter substrate-binding protein [Bifidobacterium]NEG95743.1 peptide ABC transporter substrate-binding protein [Bifidobacterium sp. SMB2]NEH11170.1 peptide ABC transporter substrate-binding protein [Bifidobacterium saimiriisciurei]
MTKTLRAFTAIMAAIMALTALSGCGTRTDSNGDAAAGTRTVTIGTTDKVSAIDPAGSYDIGSSTVKIQIYPFLYAQDYGKTAMSRDLAADDGAWNDDGTEFTVHIKPGLTWANGHVLDAHDVKFSLDRMKSIDDPNGPASLLANIKDVSAPNATTIVIADKLSYDVTLKQVLGSPAAAIVDDEVFPANKLADDQGIIAANAFGGPYTLASMKRDELFEYRRNPNYHGLTSAKNDIVQVRYFADSSNLKLAVQQGQVDVAYRSMTSTDVNDLRRHDGLKVITGAAGSQRYLTFNLRTQPYGTKQSDADAKKALAVRRAVADLIDRKALSRSVYFKTYLPTYSYLPDEYLGHEDTFRSSYGDGRGGASLAAARRVLADAGVTTPVTLRIQYNTDHYGQSSTEEYAAIKSQLETGGLFRVDVRSTEWTQYNKERVASGDSDGAYPAYQLGWGPDFPDSDDYLSPLLRDVGLGNYLGNGYRSDVVNRLIARQQSERDESRRAELLRQVQRQATKDVPAIPLLEVPQIAVTRNGVSGVVLDSSLRLRYAGISK